MKGYLDNLKRYPFAHLAILILLPLALIWGSFKRTEIPKEKTFSLFFAVETFDHQKTAEGLEEALRKYNIESFQEYGDSPVRDPLNFSSALESRGLILSDLLVLPESSITEGFCAYGLSPWKETSSTDLVYGTTSYGKEIHSKEKRDSLLATYLTYEKEEPYYLCISKRSVHYEDYLKKEESLLEEVMEQYTHEQE